MPPCNYTQFHSQFVVTLLSTKLLRGQVKANDKSQSYTADAWATILLDQNKNKETFLM